MPCCNRAGRTAILLVRDGGWEGVYKESRSYFQTFHSSNIHSKALKLYFCIYFGAAFSFNVDGKLERGCFAAGEPGTVGWGWEWGREGGRWEWVSKGVSLWPRGSTGWCW